MIFDTGFSMRQGAHFVEVFCEEAMVFRAAFSDAWIAPAGAMGIEVTCDGAEHFLNDRRDGSGLVFGASCRVAN